MKEVGRSSRSALPGGAVGVAVNEALKQTAGENGLLAGKARAPRAHSRMPGIRLARACAARRPSSDDGICPCCELGGVPLRRDVGVGVGEQLSVAGYAGPRSGTQRPHAGQPRPSHRELMRAFHPWRRSCGMPSCGDLRFPWRKIISVLHAPTGAVWTTGPVDSVSHSSAPFVAAGPEPPDVPPLGAGGDVPGVEAGILLWRPFSGEFGVQRGQGAFSHLGSSTSGAG